jgi:hypothetical protein
MFELKGIIGTVTRLGNAREEFIRYLCQRLVSVVERGYVRACSAEKSKNQTTVRCEPLCPSRAASMIRGWGSPSQLELLGVSHA